jgi:hypothetical protein
MTLAQSLDGKLVSPVERENSFYDKMAGVYTFGDGSKAKIITYFEPCEPRLVGAVTVINNRIYKWRAIE